VCLFLLIFYELCRFTTSESNTLQEESHEKPSEPIQVDDDDAVEDTQSRPKRRHTSAVWKEFKEVEIMGQPKAQCNYCHKKLCAKSSSGTKHLHCHLEVCTMRKIKLGGLKMNKTLAQSSLRMKSHEGGGGVSVEHYTFDQDVARKALAAMIILHEYPLCIVDHIGFRRFVSALQPLFKMVTRNTVRYENNIN
jgi:hypothetical protein